MIYSELLLRLKQEDEVSLLEILDLSTEELVDLLDGIIFDKQDRVREYYGEDEETLDRQEESN